MKHPLFHLVLFLSLALAGCGGGGGGAPTAAPDTITIASFNACNLGDATAIEDRAQVVANFDLVALQEVESPLGLERLRQAVQDFQGVPWASVLSSEVGGSGAEGEYYGFLYRTDRVTQTAGPSGHYVEPSPADFVREPYFATFRAGQFDFTLATVHVTWGSSSAERTAEVQRLADVWSYLRSRDATEHDVILTGDFNVDKPTNAAFQPLSLLSAFNLIDDGPGVFTTYSTSTDTIGASFYDNLWIGQDTLAEHEAAGAAAGVYYTYQHFYTDQPYPHLACRDNISDHCPVWARFSTTTDDDGPAVVPTPTPTPTPTPAVNYIGNKDTKKFHLPTCSYLPDPINRIYFTVRADAIAQGYVPCLHCNP